MRGILFLACILMLGLTKSAFCLDLQSQVSLLQYEVNKLDVGKNKEESELLKPVIESNINYLVGAISLKIKKYESRLEKIKERIQNCNRYSSNEEDETDRMRNEQLSERQWKKFYSTHKKIEMLNDLTFLVDQLKTKLTN